MDAETIFRLFIDSLQVECFLLRLRYVHKLRLSSDPDDQSAARLLLAIAKLDLADHIEGL